MKQMFSDSQVAQDKKVRKCFVDSGAVMERCAGFIWCDCDIYWFVTQIKSDTMSADVGTDGVCTSRQDVFLCLFSTLCSP